MPVPEAITNLVKNSGNHFHAKVARFLVKLGWRVVVSPYYLDQTLGKAREIDLIAEKCIPWHRQGQPTKPVAVRLFIECKYVASHAVFWFADKDVKEAKKLVCRGSPFRENNMLTDEHHYLASSSRVAKLFASTKSKTGENDPFYKALNQALNGMVSLRDQAPHLPEFEENQRLQPSAILEFPVVVCNSFSHIYSANFDDDSEPKQLTENFQFEVQYAYVDRQQNQKDEYFLVDFVEHDQLEQYLKLIEQDAENAASLAS